ncbi:hypothetical protein CHS0354_006260 [Potamilus streckersoni]|uniref:Fibronectin type-III domain-containing protein n=1 Tax=Potamilus streckersoni TaxID=2493646 RepID=A0AAE0VYA2_9BIVA|nr:hypothetical protein CHS0354_006260 [Potamilus streckersoni]
MSGHINSATTLLLLLLFCWIHTAEGGLKVLDCGAVRPVDPYAFIGERLNLTCTIHNISSNQPVQLYFLTSVKEGGTWRNVKINQTLQLNNTAIQLISPVLTLMDAQNHYVSRSYRCMVQQVVNRCTLRSNQTISNQRVKIDYFPHNPENFSCQVYNWENMTCTWDMIPYFHKKDISITYFWKADRKCEGSLLNYTVNESTTSFTVPDFKMEPDYCFYFEITNVVRDIRNTSAVFHVSPFEIVKPAPVEYISFQNISDTCVTVMWNHSKQLRQQVFRVRYTSKCSAEQQFYMRERNATVCGLNPYTDYTFIVDSMPWNMNDSDPLETVGFISDPRNNSVTTKSTVPAANPKLLSYRDLFCPKSPCRHVLLYWEPLSPCDLHDSPSGQQYEIIVKQRGSEETWNSVATDSKAVSHTLMLSDKEEAYDVKLRVITGNGKKREDFSHLVIWPRMQSPIAPSMVVEYDTMKNGTDFYITLNLTEAQLHTSQFLYWCHVSRAGGCQQPMSRREINGSSTKIAIDSYKMDFNIIFGVESRQWLLKEITQSGIQLVDCIYPKDQKPLIPPKNFRIAQWLPEREGELSLQWDPYDCNSPDIESGYVLSYTLYYCQVTDESSCKLNNTRANLGAISFEGHIYNYTVRNLQPGSRYKVWLTARTSAGKGPHTDMIDKYIFIQEFPLWGKITIPVGSVIIFLAIISCFITFHQYIKRRIEIFRRIEVPDTRIQFMNTDDYVQIRIPNCHVPQKNGHVIVDDQTAEPIPDMDESEELNRLIPLIQTLDPKIHMGNNSSSTSLLLCLKQLDMPFFGNDHKDDGSYISSNDKCTVSSGTESDRDTRDEKEIKPVAFVLTSEHSYQNANLLPEDYCRAMGNGDYVKNSKTNPTLYEDKLDHKFFKLQSEAVHSQSIDSLFNYGPELQRQNIILLNDCKGNSCERVKGVDSVCVKDSSNLSQENVTIEKQIETGQMKVKDDFESDNLALSGDDLDDAASDDSLSLWDEICGKFHKTEKTSGYVCANKIHEDAEQPFDSFNHWKYTECSSLGKDILGSDDHVKHESDNARSDSDHVRSDKDIMKSENDHVRSDADEIIHYNFAKCDYVNFSVDDSVSSSHKHKICGNRFKKFQHRDSVMSFISQCTSYHDNPRMEDHDPAVIHPYMNIVQSGFP